MAPETGMRDDWPDPPTTRNAFLEDLRMFHALRGTSVDINARVNGKHIELYRLFAIVGDRGGYDAVSSQKLEWRKVGQEFALGQTNSAAYAFALKTVYYKNLAAYAIKRVHKQEPPPKEILENISAKGGDLLSRTLENFKPPQNRDSLANGNESDGSGDEDRKTPSADRMDVDDPSSGGRATRGLRQQPPQRVLFQPDVSSSRQSRQTPNHLQSAQHPVPHPHTSYAYNPASNPNSMSFTIANYEPRLSIPLTLRPVLTPSSNPGLFKDRVRRLREIQAAKLGRETSNHKGIMLPGTGFDGPNIYVRTLLALRSGIPDEQDYALHHLVKISHERGDKYKFEAFPGLAEGLIEKALQVSSLFYDINWEISYANDCATRERNVLDGMNGTADLLERIRGLQVLEAEEENETPEFYHKLSKMNEVALIIRNMSMLEENAKFLSEQSPMEDYLTIVLNLPRLDSLIEIKHYALDMAEQLTKYWSLTSSHPLYISLLKSLDGNRDRGAALTTLRAISRISMNLEESNRLKDIPFSIVIQLRDWTLLEDEELVAACLDFFYQYTAMPENVAFLLASTVKGDFDLQPLLTQLGRLLLHNAQDFVTKSLVSKAKNAEKHENIAIVPLDLLTQIILNVEPERSSAWLRACFEENADSHITQITLWQAYQVQFTQLSSPTTPMLAAADFIKNVSTTLPNAHAQVLTNDAGQQFIINGIRPRRVPISPSGRNYTRCLWKKPGEALCGEFHLGAENVWNHVIKSHIGLSKNDNGKWNYLSQDGDAQKSNKFNCHWGGCKRFDAVQEPASAYEVGMHVKVHLPDHTAMAAHRAKYNRSVLNEQSAASHEFPDDYGKRDQPAVYQRLTWHNTAVDERNDAAGLPLTSVLILRNLARNVSKAVLALQLDSDGSPWTDSEQIWMERLFEPIKPRLWHVMTHNRPLASYVADLICTIDKDMDA